MPLTELRDIQGILSLPRTIQNSFLIEMMDKPRHSDVPTVDYSDKEKTYISGLQQRLEQAKTARDQPHPEFDGLSFISYWWANERGANTMIQATKNKQDVRFQSGTLATKMFAILASYQGLNLSADITAFNDKQMRVNYLGNAMEEIMHKTQTIENDEEWKMVRQFEMLKHGYVFVEDKWDEKWEVEKKISAGFHGKVAGVKWSTIRKKALGAPKRRIIPGPAVYLGDMAQYMISDQPYLFTVENMNWVDAEQIYGNWERWKYVSREKRRFSGTAGQEMSVNAWRFLDGSKEGQVERIRYQDKPNNELQIILNGVLMLPVGYPLTAISSDGEYTFIQQNLEPIRHDFAYGKSFIFKNKNLVAVLDEMMKLAVLKTQKSFLPPYLNLSGRALSRTMFMPGKLTRGVGKGEIAPITDKEVQGVTGSEMGMIQEVIKFVDRNTVSQTFTGAREGGQVTATQIVELQRQARLMMGLLTLAASLLEKKLAEKRLVILLDKWFDPINKDLDEARGIVKEKYRTVSNERMIDGEGMGTKMVLPTNGVIPSPNKIMEAEDRIQEQTGSPFRVIMLNPNEMKQAKLTWVVSVNAKEKKSSELSKMMFEKMVVDAMNLGLRLNLGYIEQRFAQVWEEDPSKMFMPEQQMMMPEQGMHGGQAQGQMQSAGVGTPRVTPQIKVPGQGQQARTLA